MADHLPPDGLDATYLPDVAESGNDWRKSAGDFACTACGKKRLTAMSFSKSQVGARDIPIGAAVGFIAGARVQLYCSPPYAWLGRALVLLFAHSLDLLCVEIA
jgi:hypothetical protein